MTQHLIKGCKGGSSSPRTPTEQPDDLQSVAKAKILIALGEGEFAGALTAKDIYLDGTPLENSDGSQNFSGVAWEFRPGTQAQNYIQGIPGSENEINVGVEVSSKTAWSRSFSNTQLSAVRLRLKWPSLLKQEDNGDLVGNAVSYAVDLQTDGGSWQTMLESAVSGKTTSGYERCHRIDLPRATTGWVLRLRKVTEDANTSKTGDVMMLQSYAEVLDAKLRYPNTALLYVEFDSRQFNGSIPKIACSPRGRVIRVPDNYDPETRQYSGIWTGAFKWAWTDNPAWIFYDLIVSDRFGLGNRLTSENIDKWTLYQVARYCDEPVPDGKGGEGTEPRYLCNVYVQDRNDAYTVLRDFAAIFRGMTCWSGDQVIALADMPRDIDYTYTRANVINGRFHYASSSSKTRYTNALVSWSDPENEYADAMEPVFEQPLVARYGFNQLELTAIGCTRQSEANRKGRWGILTNNKDRVVTFSVGLDGNIPQPGYIIAVADEMLAGKVNGGRTREVDGCVITLDRKTEAKAGDRLLLNLPSGGTQGRTIESVDGHVVTVTAEYAERPEPECVWAIESDSLRVQQYRVVGVKDNNDSTFTISAAAHDPDKYARIDSGAIIDSRPISVIPPGKQSAPANIVVESYSVVNQGISVETLQVHWTAVKNAIAYEAQWRRNEGNWINVPRSSVASFDVSGIYAGRYIVRVRAINAAEVSSGWAYSQEKTLTGKIGLPSAPVSLTTTSLLHGVQLNWAFPEGSGDTQKTELQYSPNPTGNGAMALSDVTYPGNSYQQMGLQIAATFWYRARIVDRLGNESPWTVWVQGMASDDIGEYYDKLTDAIKDTEAWQESQRDMEETHKTLTETADAIREEVEQQVNEINQSINETAGGVRKQVDGQIASVNKSMTENIDLVNQTLNDAISTVNKSINDAVSDINTSVDQQIADVNKALTAGDSALKSQLQTVENGLKQSIAQANTGWDKAVKQETADRIADVNAKAAQAADQLLNEKNERLASIDNLQTIIQDGDESLARQIAEISAGSGQQFDSFSIWYFDKDNEGWTEDDAGQVPMQITDEGWLKASNSTASCRSPNGQKIPGSSYRTVMLRIKRVGNPAWKGRLYWIGTEETGWSDARSVTIAEQEFDGEGISVVAISDVNWNASGTVRRFRLDLAQGQNADNYFLIHWISVGRPAPAASTAALRNEEMARTQADEVEALKRSTLAAQIRGTSDSNSLADLRSGLLYQEMNARITADKAEVTARESLQTQFNDNKSSVAEELSSLSTTQSAQASKISGLETSLGKKADATALQSLTQKVEQQGTTLTSQGNTLTSLSNRVGNTLTTQSESITSLSGSISTLRNQVSNPWFDGSLESYADGQQISGSGAIVTTAQKFNGSRSLRLRREANNGGNSDKQIGPWSSIRENAVYSVELWAMMPADQSPSTGWQTIVGIQGQNAAGQNSWQGAVTITESGLGERGKWMKFSGKARMNGTGRTRGVVWISTRGATGSGTPGYDLYIDDIVITDITDVQAVQTTADATASAVDSLTTKVSQQDNNISSIGNRTTALENGLSVTNASVNKKADANTVQTLQNTVTQQGKDLSSQGNAITSLNNIVSSVKDDISKKADTAAVFALTNRVTETEQSIRSNSDAVTSLSSSLSQQARRGANVLPDGTWESYPVGYNVANNRVLVTSDEAYSGAKCIRLIRANDYNATASDNNDCHIFAGLQVRDGATYYVEFRVKPDPKGTAMADNVQLSVGFSLQDMSGSWSWPALTKAKKDLVAEGWTKVSGYLTNNRTSIKQAMVRLSVPNVSTVKAGNAFLIDDLFITEVTDAKAALDAADANAQAIMNLKTTVTQNGEDITSQGSSITKLTNDLAITNGNVNKKADAIALQTLQNTVTQQGKEAASQGTALTSLENSLNGLSVGGVNLIRHSDTLDGWSSRSPSETYQGASVAWTRLVKGTGGYVQLDEQTLDVTGKTEFIYSFYAKGAYAAQEMTAYFYNPSNTSRIETNQGYKSSAGDGAAQFTLTTSWQRYWVRWVIPATAGTKRLIPARLQHAPSADKEVWLCRPKLETGNVVTDWTPNNDDIAAEIQANAGAVQNLSTRVTTAEGKITSSGTAITRLQNDLALTQADVSKKADTTALQTVQNSVTQQDKDITAANSAITKLISDLSTTNANVSKKADASALQTLQNTITQQGGTLTTQGSAIVSLENSLNALDVGGANQIPDSGSLIRYGNVSTDKYNGNGVMAFTLKAGAAYRDLISINLSAPVDGTEYVLSFYAKAAINGQKVRSHFYSPNSTKKAVSSQGNTFTNSDGLCDFTLTTEWQRYWVKWTQGAGTGSKKLIVARIQQGSTDQTVYLSSPKFERGNVPTAWSEAPEDNASAAAVSALTSRVDSAEGVLTSQGQLLTSLQNGLTTADQNIGKKADSSAVNTLTNRVSQVENTLTTQSESITSLSGSISTLRNQVSNPWFDGSLESYADGQQISGSGAIVTTAQKFNGSRSLRLRREANNGGNSDKQIGPWSSIRENAVYSVELWAMMPADQSPSTGWQTIVGIQGQNAAGQNSWQGAVTITESGLGERGKWMKFSGKARMNGTGRTRGVVWISTRGATGSGTPGYDLYIDDIVITDVTDAQTALDVADASTTAVSGLTTRVTNAEAKITAHSQQITSLQSSLSGKADAEAVNTLSSRVTSAEGKIESTASGLTSLNSTVGSLSSTVQAQGQTLSDTNGKVNSTYSIKVETNNGKKVGAGIVLGSDGSTSDMILYADRFSLFNRNSKAAVPVMIAEGNELYIDSARIKNGTIDIAKITDRLSSTNYVAGWRGWSITKSGSSEFNNVVVRGEIQADTGTLNNVVINESCNILGTVRANKIIGDVGSWAINIAQHRSRRIAKAQWAWFDLLAVDRQPFEQRVQLLGALRQDDSINITGGGKLTAGMEYRSYEGGSLSMGKLGYCILMLGTGATSGGGPMTCALSIDGVLYKQENESMEIQSMDFIVPPGTGQTVVRYGYYLDRNGGMTGVILSRFHAFVMRNSNIIRGVSSD
ncbi:phage tail tip protein [Klebsiella michiganensis]|uniref:TipJ family phage tail tip protein n=1 Tax=Klebsiella michiganensis TaxID=1134687 RepID=UPI0039907BF0